VKKFDKVVKTYQIYIKSEFIKILYFSLELFAEQGTQYP